MAARRKAKKKGPVLPKQGKRDLFTAEHERLFLQLLQACMYPAEAARKLGFTPQAISMRKKRHPEFAQAIAMAEASAEFSLIATMLKASQKDWKAALALAERRFKERWSKPEVQQQLNMSAADTDAIVAGIQAFLAEAEVRHSGGGSG